MLTDNRAFSLARVGSPVPEWKAKTYAADGQFSEVDSESLKGRWYVLFFWPLDFTFVCPTEIRAFGAAHEEFEKLDAVVLGCSTDSVYTHKAWSEGELGQMPFSMIGDTSQRLARLFGVLVEEEGVALRGTFIVDPDGVLVSSTVNHLNVGRNVEETVRTLQAFQVGELMPCGWTPGQKTLGKT
jgi:peroxiredoxin 2/4